MMLIDLLASWNEFQPKTGTPFPIFFGKSALWRTRCFMLPASHENLGIMQLIGLHCPSMIMKQNSNGDTALHVAAGSGCHFVVCTLLRLWLQGDQVDYRATYEIIDDLNLLRVRNKKGNTALHEAMINGHKHCAFLLIDKDPEVSYFLNMKGESPLYLAAKAGYEETINFMFQEIRNKDECLKGKSPLQAAITRRNKGLISMILQNEPRFINLRDKEGRTALHYAAFMGYNEEVQYLLELFSASPIERDNDGLFPIHLAATEGHIQTIRVLLRHYPDPKEMLNLNGQSILHIATNAEKHDVVSYILKNHALGFLINCRDLDGNTALHLAAIKSNALIVSTMVQDMRVDLEIINNEGLSVLNVVEQFIERAGVNEKQLIRVALSAARYTNARSWCSICRQSRD
ncbi:hypothetical protein Nepgr_000429 [Nepenthes gracilis]|uniref:Uncharacterized protein n=1 Tax=Nepenthes gracilis TaxID=150966 RepID=A0AAD3P1S6_NEPGR|nr:hypothetical protein Nepgr_000429 [Nepenthes gracilis]